jgi:glycosyltransferase involved in cell wall biosynthesis
VTVETTIPLSVVVIAQNEERMIQKCLDSVDWAAERIVVDGYSHDQTAELASRAGALVLQRTWSGFADQKSYGLRQATQPWILSLDADEQVTPSLAAEVRNVIASERQEAAFRIRIPLYFMGRELGHYGRTRSDPGEIKLFRRGRGRFDSAIVHERVVVDGEVGSLSGKILNDSYPDPALRSYRRKIHRYAELEAQQRARSGRTGNRWIRAAGKLAWMLFMRRGILDGPRAWIWISGQGYMEWLVTGRCNELLRAGDAGLRTDAV